jgi:uncharacterized protein DUF5658
MLTSSPCFIPLLFILNLSLQAWDGLATYYGLSLGVQEGNPLIQAAIDHLGAGWALLGTKGLACSLLIVLRAFSQSVLCVQGLLLTAVIYYVCSFLPWCFVLWHV